MRTKTLETTSMARLMSDINSILGMIVSSVYRQDAKDGVKKSRPLNAHDSEREMGRR